MTALLRTVHGLSVALWFGAVAFFTVAGLLIFQGFERVSLAPAGERPAWFPVPEVYTREPPPESNFPDPLRREQGSRAAGVAVSAIFPVYFALQAGCAGVAVLTAVGLALRDGGRLNGVRVAVCVLGVATVLGGWWLERRVHELRGPRNDRTDAVLTAAEPTPGAIAEARAARAEFGRMHGVSLLVNFGTLGVALVAAALAAHHPAGDGRRN